MLEIDGGVRLDSRIEPGKARLKHRSDLLQTLHRNWASFEECRPKGRASSQLHPVGDHRVDGRQRVVVNMAEVPPVVATPLFERAAVEQIQELEEEAEEERLGL